MYPAIDQRGRAREVRPGPAGVALVPGRQDRLATWAEQVIRRCRGPRAPRDVSHVDDEDENPRDALQSFHGLSPYAGSPPVSLRNHRMHVCPKSAPGPNIIGQAPAITLMLC